MQELRRMKSIETMERITRQKFCDNFDEILDRVDKEDIGFVILNDELYVASYASEMLPIVCCNKSFIQSMVSS